MISCRTVGLAAALSLAASRTEAEDLDVPQPAASTEAITAQAAFLPWTASAAVEGRRGLAYGAVGWDGGRKDVMTSIAAEVSLAGRLALRAGAASTGPAGDFDPTITLQLDVLRQRDAAVDLAIVSGYEASGFNTVPAWIGRVALGRSFGAARVVADLGYSAGLADGERAGSASFGMLVHVTPHGYAGLDARFAIDLERDADEPIGEPDWQLVAGPVASYVIGSYVVTATAGVSSLKYRLVPGEHTGEMGMFGLGRAF
jgi:hypothetical protein